MCSIVIGSCLNHPIKNLTDLLFRIEEKAYSLCLPKLITCSYFALVFEVKTRLTLTFQSLMATYPLSLAKLSVVMRL